MLEKWIKYREIISYLFWGVMTTLMNWISYAILIKKFKTDTIFSMGSYVIEMDVFTANILSWLFAVVFAFVTNKLFVFRSTSWHMAVFLPELWKFVSARIATGVIEIFAVPVLVGAGLNQQIFGIEGSLAKGIVTVVVIALNYAFSKLLVFRVNKESALENINVGREKEMGDTDSLYIVIPAYNERATIQDVIDQWYPIVERVGYNSKLVVVNDGSKDDTYEIMQKCAAERPRFIPLTKENEGHGATVLYAYQYALNPDGGVPDYIFQTDSDGQTLPEEFWTFWEQRHEYDMIIGHRNHRKDGFSRIIVTKVLKLTIRVCFHVSITDANTPYRLMNAEILRENIDLVPQGFNLSNVILSVIYAKKGLRVKYLPITFRPRQGGVNSINLKKIFCIGVKALKDFRTINSLLG